MIFKGFIRNKQETIGILGLLLVVLSLTGLLGCPSPTPPVKSATAMEGTFTYADLTTAVGNQKEGSPEWSGNADNQLDSGNIGYTITPLSGKAGTGVTINPDNGIITVGTTATAEASSGTYTVTATGKGAFKGTENATIEITINAIATPMKGTLTYADLTTAVGNQKEGSPEWSGNADNQLDSGNIGYTITPLSGKAGTGVTINPDNGIITVGTTATAEASSGKYDVTATGKGAFKGTIDSTITITISAIATPITGTLTYDDLTVAVGSLKEISPSWSGNADKQLDSGNIEYTITSPPGKAGTGVTINTDNGIITVGTTATAEASSGTYTVTATGKGAFKGTIDSTITITISATATPITGTLTYDDLTVTIGNSKEISPSWSGNADKQLDSGNIEYTITSPSGKAGTGVTINTDDGKITVGTTATAEASSGEYTVTATGTGDWQGTKIATIEVTITKVAKAIGGSFSYDGLSDTGLSTVKGTPKTSPRPIWTSPVAGQTVEYSITDAIGAKPTHVTVDTDTGVVTITDKALVASAEEYTVTATGTGDFKDTRTAKIQITITKKPITATLSYGAIETEVGNTKTQAASWSPDDTARTVTYVIAPAKDGISINQATGEITVSDTAPASTGTYTVTATGIGDWQGTETATIQITITATGRTPIRGEFSYENVTVAIGEDATATPEWGGEGYDPTQLTNGYTYYSVTPTPSGGITFENPSGVFNVKNPTTAGSETYTVTAIGLKDYSGTKTATITITINASTTTTPITGKFTYADLTTEFGNSKHVKPEWITDSPDQLTSGNMIYSIAPSGTDIHIDIVTGMVSTYSDTPATSSGTYTVTATGQKDYKDSITADITITIAQKSLTGRFSYSPITVAAGTPGLSFYPRWEWDENEEKDPDQITLGNIEYSIAPPSGNDGTGVTISEHNGDVYFDSTTTVASAGVYTVTATGIGSFTGKITSTITIIVNASAIPLSGEFSYDHIMTVAGSLERYYYHPEWVIPKESEGEQNPHVIFAEYSITPPLGNAGKGVQITKNSGDIYVDSTATVESSGVYTVTATGVNKFEGTITADVKITVNAEVIPITGTLKYAEGLTAVAGGTPKVEAPTWTGIENDDQKISGSITYTITPPSVNPGDHVEITPSTGEVYIIAHAAPVESVGVYVYTVTATGRGAFTGKITAPIKITLTERKPLVGSFSYGNEGVITVTTDTKTIFPLNWIGHDTDQLEPYNIYYKIEPGFRFFSSGTGNLELEGISVEDSGTYTVTATGTGDFQGTKTASVTITVTEP